MLKTMSKSDIMKGALDVNSLTAAVAIKTVSEMALWKSSSGASEIEKGYLEAPYTQARTRTKRDEYSGGGPNFSDRMFSD